MYIYNITFNIEPEVYEDWKIWLEEVFVLELQKAQFHQKSVFLEVLSRHQSGRTFTLQLHIDNHPAFVQFENTRLNRLKSELFNIFSDKVLVFDTMLKNVSEDFNL